MRKAVKDKKARPADLALLEDRILMRQNKKQIYGSQIVREGNGPWSVYPIADPKNVDFRRAEVGLGPIADYLSQMGLTWDVEEHLKLTQKSKQ
jgi:hypothetical protein